MKNLQFGLIGRNISLSLSPLLHNGWFKDYNLPFLYQLFDLPDVSFINPILETDGGYNVTAPYKKDIFSKCTFISSYAKHTQAVNTLFVKKPHILGHNTDVAALIRLFKPYCTSSTKHVCLLGNGGAASAAKYALSVLEGFVVHQFNRTPCEKENICSLEKVNETGLYDVFINATPMKNPPIPKLNPKSILLDMNYIPLKPRWMENNDSHVTILGIQMLIEQASFSFMFWDQCIRKFCR